MNLCHPLVLQLWASLLWGLHNEALAAEGVAASAVKKHAMSKELKDIVDTTAACMKTGNICLAHCQFQLGAGDVSLAECQRTVMGICLRPAKVLQKLPRTTTPTMPI